MVIMLSDIRNIYIATKSVKHLFRNRTMNFAPLVFKGFKPRTIDWEDWNQVIRPILTYLINIILDNEA